jgi:tetratricopeptide (TPR) repeat protein
MLVDLVRGLDIYWYVTFGVREAYEWYHAALDHGLTLPPDVRAELLGFAGHAANSIGLVEESIGLCRASLECSDDAGLARVPMALLFLGLTALESNHPEAAIAYCDDALVLAREHGDAWDQTLALGYLALVCALGGEPERGRMLADEGLTAARHLGQGYLVSQVLLASGTARVESEPEMAVELLQELPTASRIGGRLEVGEAALFKGIALLRLGRRAEAARSMQSALVLLREHGGDFFISTVIATVAAMLTRSEPAVAAVLLAAVDRYAAESGASGAPADVATRQRSRARVEQTLGRDAFADAWAQGEAMSIDEAAALAHDELDRLST